MGQQAQYVAPGGTEASVGRRGSLPAPKGVRVGAPPGVPVAPLLLHGVPMQGEAAQVRQDPQFVHLGQADDAVPVQLEAP